MSNERALSLILAIAAQESNNERTPLMLLLRASEISEKTEKKEITEKEVLKAKENLEEKIILNMISSLPEQQQTVLLSIALLSEEKKGIQKLNENERLLFSGEVYDEYKRQAKRLEYSNVSMRWFREYLNELEL